MPVWVMALLLALVLLSSVRVSASPPSALSTVRGGKVLHLLRTAWRQAAVQKLPMALLVSGALMLAAPTVAHEQERLLTEVVQPLAVTEAAKTRSFSWVIKATLRGTVGHMRVQVTERQEEVRISGHIEPTARGIKYLGAQPVRSYRTDETYTTDNNEYNGITLPLRISWLAAERRREIASISTLVEMLAENEAVLLRLGESMYRDFSELHIADVDDYRFDNLAEQIEIKFAGKKFFDRNKVRREINKRQKELWTKEITYKQRQHDVQLDQDVLTRAAAAYQAVLAARQSSSALAPKELRLNFDTRAANDNDFRLLAHSLARFKQARLLLARELLRLYEPFTLTFFYAIGTEEHLKVTVFADDRKRSEATFRYEMRTTSVNYTDKFTLGRISFDDELLINHMWLSLKPRGNVPGFAKLSFIPMFLHTSE